MRLKLSPSASGLLSLSFLASTTLALTYSYYRLWNAYLEALATTPGPPGSEQRLIIGTALASAVALLAALVSWWDRRTSLRLERQKKALELRTQAAFDMWRAVTTAYRLMNKAALGRYSVNDANKITGGFETAEGGSLLFDERVQADFTALWHKSAELTERLLPAAGAPRADQPAIWQTEVKAYADLYDSLRARLRDCIAS